MKQRVLVNRNLFHASPVFRIAIIKRTAEIVPELCGGNQQEQKVVGSTPDTKNNAWTPPGLAHFLTIPLICSTVGPAEISRCTTKNQVFMSVEKIFQTQFTDGENLTRPSVGEEQFEDRDTRRWSGVVSVVYSSRTGGRLVRPNQISISHPNSYPGCVDISQSTPGYVGKVAMNVALGSLIFSISKRVIWSMIINWSSYGGLEQWGEWICILSPRGAHAQIPFNKDDPIQEQPYVHDRCISTIGRELEASREEEPKDYRKDDEQHHIIAPHRQWCILPSWKQRATVIQRSRSSSNQTSRNNLGSLESIKESFHSTILSCPALVSVQSTPPLNPCTKIDEHAVDPFVRPIAVNPSQAVYPVVESKASRNTTTTESARSFQSVSSEKRTLLYPFHVWNQSIPTCEAVPICALECSLFYHPYPYRICIARILVPRNHKTFARENMLHDIEFYGDIEEFFERNDITFLTDTAPVQLFEPKDGISGDVIVLEYPGKVYLEDAISGRMIAIALLEQPILMETKPQEESVLRESEGNTQENGILALQHKVCKVQQHKSIVWGVEGISHSHHLGYCWPDD
ncbi:hypothetical protein PROFUN_15938 [Planoprotostelium fungivorum]|uniref:Uncharacterized protein n=1 Tax=Planoprotostelium fungivorum TaxID=1890364 RepID=A0A2P6MU15_9EUKA|nr:hypothetical protein PROFUN_15938 [Planoprotostelium fungivorum]